MGFGILIVQFLRALFTCSHVRSQVVEGKTYCPDCGQGVVFRWVVLRCGGCGQRRQGRYRFREVVPTESCCTFCGERAVHSQYLSDPEYFQLSYALLRFESDPCQNTLADHIKVVFSSCIQKPFHYIQYSYAESSVIPLQLPSH